LFDLEGKVIGINSRIGLSITDNVHVPVDTYRENWDRLAKGEVWGGGLLGALTGPKAGGAFLGIVSDPESESCKIGEIREGSPAEKAGLQVDDIIRKFDGKRIESFEDLRKMVADRKPGDRIDVEVRRGLETVKMRVVLGKRPE
jgi:serine protease Do